MTLIKMRRGTEEEWLETNPVLSQGELGYSKDLKRLKVGDGSTIWQFLPFVATDLEVDLATSPEYAQDAVAAMLSAGTHSGIQFVYDDTNQKMNVIVTAQAGPSFTNEDAQDAIAALIANGTHSGITFAYDDVNNRLNATVPVVAGYTDEQAQDAIFSMLVSGPHDGISYFYNDTANTFSIRVSDSYIADLAVQTIYTAFNNTANEGVTFVLEANNKISAHLDLNLLDDRFVSKEEYTNSQALLSENIRATVASMVSYSVTVNGSLDLLYDEDGNEYSFVVNEDWVKSVAGSSGAKVPDYAGPRTGMYDSASKVYVSEDNALGVSRYVLAEAMAGTSLVPFVFMGDSITAGHKAVPGISDPVTVLRNLLVKEGYPVTGGWVFPANGTTRDARWSITGTWADANSTVSNFLDTVQPGATAKFVGDFPGTIVEFTVFSTAGTNIIYQVDNSNPVNLAVSPGALRKIQVTGLADTTHQVTITNNGSTQRLWLGPARIRQTTGLSLTNAAIFGSKASDWLPTAVGGVYFNPYNLLGSLEIPKMAFIGLGANEIINDSTSTPASIANTLDTLVGTLQDANAAVVLRSYPPSIGGAIFASRPTNLNSLDKWQSLWFNVADDYGVPLVDHFGGLGSQTEYKAAGMSWTDSIHPLDRGYAGIARRDLAALKRMV